MGESQVPAGPAHERPKTYGCISLDLTLMPHKVRGKGGGRESQGMESQVILASKPNNTIMFKLDYSWTCVIKYAYGQACKHTYAQVQVQPIYQFGASKHSYVKLYHTFTISSLSFLCDIHWHLPHRNNPLMHLLHPNKLQGTKTHSWGQTNARFPQVGHRLHCMVILTL